MDTVSAAPGSISFFIVTENGIRQVHRCLDVIAEVRRDTDEVFVVTRSDQTALMPTPPPSWLRLVGIPDDASIFTLRAQIPALARREWVLLLEDHSFVSTPSLDAIRAIIDGEGDVDLIPFFGKNLTSTTPWGWASFLYGFAQAWAPSPYPPQFSLVTAAVVRRSALGHEAPLAEGQWEQQVIPRIFATGRNKHANEIYIDHVKPLDALSCFAINFNNFRIHCVLMRRLGAPLGKILGDGWSALLSRPQGLMDFIGERRHEAPPGMLWRMRVIGFACLLGSWAGVLFGPGRAAHRLD
jgi:hypothetical protein